MRAAILPLPPTKGTTVRQSMRGVAYTKKARALSEPSARPQLSTILLAGAQGPPPSWVCHEHLEWIEQEVARRVAAALLALSKDETAPAASAGAPYKDAGTQVDAVIPTSRASGAGDDCVLIEKKVYLLLPKLCLAFLCALPLSNNQIGGEKKNLYQATLLTIFRDKRRKKSRQRLISRVIISLLKGPTKSCRQRLRNRRYDRLTKEKRPRGQSKRRCSMMSKSSSQEERAGPCSSRISIISIISITS